MPKYNVNIRAMVICKELRIEAADPQKAGELARGMFESTPVGLLDKIKITSLNISEADHKKK